MLSTQNPSESVADDKKNSEVPRCIFKTNTMEPKRQRLPGTKFVLGALFFCSHQNCANGFLIPDVVRGNSLPPASPISSFPKMIATMPKNHGKTSSRIKLHPDAIDSLTMASSSFHLSAIEVFDGSSIVDPVVVSSNFWSSLERQLVSVILGQFLASVVFAILVSALAPQLSALRDMIVAKFTASDDTMEKGGPTQTFIKADSIARQEPDFGKLSICLLIDIVGTASEALPIIGEFTDVLTAPAAALILQNLYPGSSKFVFFFEFAEEILPLTDFIPFATICWVVDTYYPESKIAELFQLGNYNGSATTMAEKAESIDTLGERVYESSDSDTRR